MKIVQTKKYEISHAYNLHGEKYIMLTFFNKNQQKIYTYIWHQFFLSHIFFVTENN